MPTTAPSRPRDERGAAAVEFALVLPILLMLMFGIVEFAMALNAQQAVTAAAREGVRIVALGGTCGEATTRAQAAGSPIPAGELNVTACTACPEDSDAATHVTVQHVYEFLTPLPAFVPGVGANITLTGEGEMRCGG